MVKTGLVGVTAHVLVTTELPQGPRQLVAAGPSLLAAALALMGLLGGMADMAAAVATWALGLTIIPSFDRPWQSTSLADFWGRRWNTATSAVLRALVYDPIMEDPSSQSHGSCNPSMASADAGSKPRTAADVAARSKRWRRVVGTLATFLVSGLMHEWMLYMEMPRFWGPWTGKITVFFALQGPLLLAESQLPRALQQAGLPPLPSLLACALTGTLLMATATPFYFGAVEPPAGDLAPRVNKGVHDSFMATAEVVLHHPQVAKAWAEVRRLAAWGS
ncbi:hypothetical protein QJQ45_022861 [Haematococcus lacustris]|nr:hypothetical protein QJQ45_022861 [Haematococcus lacustris]